MSYQVKNTAVFVVFLYALFGTYSSHAQSNLDSVNSKAKEYVAHYYEEELAYLDKLLEQGYMHGASMLMRYRLRTYFQKNAKQHQTYDNKIAVIKANPSPYKVLQSIGMGDVMARIEAYFQARSFYNEALVFEAYRDTALQRINRLDTLIHADTFKVSENRFPYLMYYEEGWEVREFDEIIDTLALHCERDSLPFNGVLAFESIVLNGPKFSSSGYKQELYRFENGYPVDVQEKTYHLTKIGNAIRAIDYTIPSDGSLHYLFEEIYDSGDTTFTKRYYENGTLSFINMTTHNRVSQISWNEHGEITDEYQWESSDGIIQSKEYMLNASLDTLALEATYWNKFTNEYRFRKLERNADLDTITFIVQQNDRTIGVEYRPLFGGEQDHPIRIQWENGWIMDFLDENVVFVNAKGYLDEASFISTLQIEALSQFPAYSVTLENGTKYALLCVFAPNETEEDQAKNQQRLAQIEKDREKIVKRWLKKNGK